MEYTGVNMKSLLFSISLILSFNVFAQPDYVCKHGEYIRNIDIVYSVPGEQVPCKVVYIKSTGTRTFWSTDVEVGYCESKAEKFANKKINQGWTCINKSEPQYDSVNGTPTEGHRVSFL